MKNIATVSNVVSCNPLATVSNVVSCNPVYYVAGPMRAYAEFNFPAFDQATEWLRAQGSEVFNPDERDNEKGFDAAGMTGFEDLAEFGFDLRDALADDTDFICRRATHIYMLPGWANSKGAIAERALALALDLTIEGAPA